MESFDCIPTKPKPYKYFEKPPKDKCARRRLKAEPCSFCKDYYSSLEKDGIDRAHISCRHRVYHSAPKTPPHYWDIDFPSFDIPTDNYKFKPMAENRYHISKTRFNDYHGLDVKLISVFDTSESESIFEQLELQTSYLKPKECRIVLANGKSFDVPRKVAMYGDEGFTYTFSGQTFSAKPWIPVLIRLRDVANRLTGETFNFVVVNRYKDGMDSIGPHKDDEPDLDPNSSIVSFSFGAERLFIFSRLYFPNVEMTLPPGSALIMKPPTNQYWNHALPKQTRVKTARINCTFRVIKTSTSF